MKQNSRRISLALGGGGARGFAHVGVLKELQRRGVTIAEVAGTSIGAVIGAYYAFHESTEELEWLAQSLTKKQMLTYLDPTIPKQSLMKGKKFRGLLEKWFGERRIEEARIPLAIVATNLRTGKAAVFRKGPVVETIMASVAIPGLLPAVRIGQEYYVDGSLAAQVPTLALRKRNTTRVAVELTLAKLPERFTSTPSMVETLTYAYALARQRGQEAIDCDILIKPEVDTFQETLSFYKARKYTENGIKAARTKLRGLT